MLPRAEQWKQSGTKSSNAASLIGYVIGNAGGVGGEAKSIEKYLIIVNHSACHVRNLLR